MVIRMMTICCLEFSKFEILMGDRVQRINMRQTCMPNFSMISQNFADVWHFHGLKMAPSVILSF